MENIETIGLVLSGGGTKGVAHAGVLKFLNEKDIAVDRIACCSAGSIVAALYSVGKSPEEILHFFQSIYLFSWKHLTISKSGFLSSTTFREHLEPILGDLKIGDLEVDLKIVATEMVSGSQVVFDKEFNLIDAVSASCSIPGISVPFIKDDKVYCDGGVLNNFPADIIRFDCDKIIGVFLSPPQSVQPKDLDSIKSVISRSYDLISYRTEQYKFAYCDWFITSQDLAQFGTFEKKASRLQEIYDLGYQSAQETYSWGDEEIAI
ncbi:MULTISPECIES: patatin-like phospholipase family protein [Amniculibacterium]|uniref:patatin-like phospholipase family protein n=1 Tax=Amniculibacterium TaxID=2715289 RepID=UPI000F58F6A1|nr:MULTISPECIES: patatin-like phospholipase family protein [Amniculibacterium]